MNQKWQAVKTFVCRHKYLITSVFFITVIGFVGESSVLQRVLNQVKLLELQNDIKKYQTQYNNDTKELDELNHNPHFREKVAREKYFMKDSLEDIYVFEDDLKQEDNN